MLPPDDDRNAATEPGDGSGARLDDRPQVVSPEELDRRIDEALQRQRRERAAEPVADTSMFLSHHWPAQYDRCAVVRRRHVCRRCLVLYPLALLSCVLAAVGLTWPTRLDPWFLWLLPLPGVAEFCLDAMGLMTHRPRRQVIVSALLAVAYGKVLLRYVHHPGDGLAWAVVGVDCGLCLVAALIGQVLSRGAALVAPDGPT